MICERIKELRQAAGYSQAQLAKKLDVTRSSINAWEMGLSTPTTQYVVAIAKLFHVSTDYILGTESEITLSLRGYSKEQLDIIANLLDYFDKNR